MLAAALISCGRQATLADCQLIVDKSVEIQLLESSASSAEVEKRIEQVRGALESEISACKGRRVTDRTLSCVKAAKRSKELEQCLR